MRHKRTIYMEESTEQKIEEIKKTNPYFRSKSDVIHFLVQTYNFETDTVETLNSKLDKANKAINELTVKLQEMINSSSEYDSAVKSVENYYEDLEVPSRKMSYENRESALDSIRTKYNL